MDKIKYLILDYGDVLFYPGTEHWFITPNFYEIIGKDYIDINCLDKALAKVSNIISRKMITEDEEVIAFTEVYKSILSDLNITDNIDDKAIKIASDFVYSKGKHGIYNDVKDNLKRLSQKYKILMLSDNWPCARTVLKDEGIYDYFEKIYISSEYGCQKKDRIFFDFLIEDFNIKKGEAIFVDDKEILLDIAKEKNLGTILMDRNNKCENSKHRIIHSLNEI